MSLRASILGSTFLFSTLLTLCDAQAQPMRRMERDASRAEVGRSANQLADDMRDLQNFRQTLAAFDFAWQNRDAAGVSNALNSFVAQGRREVAEQRRETNQAYNEANRSGWEARRDRTWKDNRDARDDRRDAHQERQELMQETAALSELERAVAATYQWGPNVPALSGARRAMVRFIQLAEQEVRRRRCEREDQRAVARRPALDATGLRPATTSGLWLRRAGSPAGLRSAAAASAGGVSAARSAAAGLCSATPACASDSACAGVSATAASPRLSAAAAIAPARL